MPFFAGTDFEPRGHHGTAAPRGINRHGRNVPRAADGTVDAAAMAAGLARLQKAAGADGRTWRAIMGVDQEAARREAGAPLTEWPAPMSYGAAGDLALATDAGKALASELAGLGFDADFAPATDVTAGPQDPTIGASSMSGNPDAAQALSWLCPRNAVGRAPPSAKHFPGTVP